MKLINIIFSGIFFIFGNVHASQMQPPSVAAEDFQYQCELQVTKVKADSLSRYSSALKATAVLEYSKGKPFSTMIPLSTLEWKPIATAVGDKPLENDLKGIAASLDFYQDGESQKAFLVAAVNQQSKSEEFSIKSFGTSKAEFEVGKVIAAEAIVEERSNWSANKAPQGILMSSTNLKVNCVRTK